jgi:hypothetical protein
MPGILVQASGNGLQWTTVLAFYSSGEARRQPAATMFDIFCVFCDEGCDQDMAILSDVFKTDPMSLGSIMSDSVCAARMVLRGGDSGVYILRSPAALEALSTWYDGSVQSLNSLEPGSVSSKRFANPRPHPWCIVNVSHDCTSWRPFLILNEDLSTSVPIKQMLDLFDSFSE